MIILKFKHKQSNCQIDDQGKRNKREEERERRIENKQSKQIVNENENEEIKREGREINKKKRNKNKQTIREWGKRAKHSGKVRERGEKGIFCIFVVVVD